jgi:phosphoglycolate phosphatase
MADIGADPEQAIYVGDSLVKDIAMAQEAGVTDVFARYGVMQHREEYELLRRVSHWTDADIERERKMRALQNVHASYTMTEAFAGLLDLFGFEPFVTRSMA